MEAKLADTVHYTLQEIEAKESENENLRNEFSKLREAKADSEANITRLTGRVHELEESLAETVPRSKFESSQSETKTLREELSKLRDDKAQSKASMIRITGRVHELEAELAETIPRTELEDLKVTLEAKINDLETRLSGSVPKEEADNLQARLRDLASKLAESIPRREADLLRGNIEELEKKLARSKSEADALRIDLAQLHDRLTESIPKAESEARVNELETKLAGARRKLEVVRSMAEGIEGQLTQSSTKIDELQSKLSMSVDRTELNARQVENEKLHNELSKLSGDEAQSEARIERIGNNVANIVQDTSPSKTGESETRTHAPHGKRILSSARGYMGDRLAPSLRTVLALVIGKEKTAKSHLIALLRRERHSIAKEDSNSAVALLSRNKKSLQDTERVGA